MIPRHQTGFTCIMKSSPDDETGGIQASSAAKQFRPVQIHPDTKKTSALGRGFFQSDELKDIG